MSHVARRRKRSTSTSPRDISTYVTTFSKVRLPTTNGLCIGYVVLGKSQEGHPRNLRRVGGKNLVNHEMPNGIANPEMKLFVEQCYCIRGFPASPNLGREGRSFPLLCGSKGPAFHFPFPFLSFSRVTIHASSSARLDRIVLGVDSLLGYGVGCTEQACGAHVFDFVQSTRRHAHGT